MKIGFVLDDSLDRPDGVQQYITTLGIWLGKQGHEVHYLVSESTRTDIPHIHSLSPNVRVRFNKNRMSIPLPANQRKIASLLNELKLDILHAQLPYSPLLGGRIIKQASHEALVGTFHIVTASGLARTGSRVLGKLQQTGLSKFHTILAVSEPAAHFARTYYNSTAQILPNCVDISRYKKNSPAKRNGTPCIVFLGRLVERKGCQYLLKAVNELRHRNNITRFKLLIGGDGPLAPQLKRYVIKNNLDEEVEFKGFIEEKDKPSFLAMADIAVFPAVGGESFGIVLIEAMAAGSGVVIAGDNAGYRSVMEDNAAVLFSPTKTLQLASLLDTLLTNSAERSRLHAWQQELVKQYDVATVGRQLLDVYTQAIAKRAHNGDN